MFFATALLIACFVYAAGGQKYLRCISPDSTSEEKFFLPKDKLNIRCNVTANLKRYEISEIYLLFNNRSWDYSTNLSYTVGQDEYNFQIPRENLTSEYTAWFPKEPWKVFSNVLHSTGKFLEFQGTLLDGLTEPILQWSFGTPVTNIQLTDNSSMFLTQSTCALDVVIIVPRISTESQINIGVTRRAFADGDIEWFLMKNLCQVCRILLFGDLALGCQFLDLVLVNHYLLILMENTVFLSNFLLEEGKTINRELLFTPVFNIPNCVSVKKGQLIYTPQCRYHIDDDFQDDTIVLLYQCLTASSDTVTTVHLSSSATNFSKWTAVDLSSLSHPLLALAFDPQTDNLIVLYDLNSVSTAEVYPVLNGLNVQDSAVASFNFPANSRMMGLFIHPISNYLYAYGEQVWLSTDTGLSFDAMPSPVRSDTINLCRSAYSDGSIACVTANKKILYSKGNPGRVWNVEPQTALTSSQLSVYFDYMENLYACYVETGQLKTVKVDAIEGIMRGSLSYSNPLMIEILSDREIHFFEYRLSADGNTNFSEFSRGLLLNSSKGGSVVLKHVEQFVGPTASRGFTVMLQALMVEKLVPDSSSALSATLIKVIVVKAFSNEDACIVNGNSHVTCLTSGTEAQFITGLQGWSELTYEGELLLGSGSWAADDVWKTVVVPYTASFLIKEVTGARAKATSVTNVRSMTTVPGGKWKIYDFRGNSWSLREDKCRHSLHAKCGDSKNYTVVDVDLRTTADIEISLGLSAPYDVGSDAFLYGYLSNPSVFQTRFYPSSSISPLLEKLSVEIMPILNRKALTTLRVFAVGASMLCAKTHILFTIYGACSSERMLVFNYPNNVSRESFLPIPKDTSEEMPVIDLKPNYRPPSRLGYGIPTSDNIYNADPKMPRRHEDFKISKQTGRFKQCAKARTKEQCGCTDRLRMTDEARYSDCKMRAFQQKESLALETNFTMLIYGQTAAVPDNYLIRIFDVNNRSIKVQYKKGGMVRAGRIYSDEITGASASPFSTALREDKRFAKMAKEHFEPNSIEIVMEGSGLYHLRAELMNGLSYCPLYSEFQVYVTTTQLQYPVPFVINFTVALVLGAILFILALWYLMKHQYTPAISSTGSKCRDLNMTNIEPLHPPHSLLAESLSVADRSRLSAKGDEGSATELLESAKAQDLESEPPHPKHEHAA